MNKYSKNFIIGWSIGFALLLIFNLLLFFAPALDNLVSEMLNSLGAAAVLVYLFLWPVLLFSGGLATFGMVLAIIVDIIVLIIFYSVQKKSVYTASPDKIK